MHLLVSIRAQYYVYNAPSLSGNKQSLLILYTMSYFGGFNDFRKIIIFLFDEQTLHVFNKPCILDI